MAAEGRLPRAEDQEAAADDPDCAAGGVLPRRGLGQRLARLQVQDRHLRQLQRGQAGPQDARQEEGRQEWRDQLVIMLSLVNKINYIYWPSEFNNLSQVFTNTENDRCGWNKSY